MPSLGGWEFVILIGILVLLFGAKKLPDMARSIGQSARVFKGEMKGMKGDEEAAKTDTAETAETAEKSDKPADPPAVLPPSQPGVQETAGQNGHEPSRASQPGPSSTGQ